MARYGRCADCGTAGRLHARGLCFPCYRRRRTRGTLGQRPRERERSPCGEADIAYRYVPRLGASAIWLLPGRPMEG